jgi:hypothetical protein
MALLRFQYSAAMLAFLVGLCLVASRARADEVDDLLAGRPVAVESVTIDPMTIDLVADETPLNTFTSSRVATSLTPSSPNPSNNEVATADERGLETQGLETRGPATSPAWSMSIGNTADHGLGRTAEHVEVPGFDMSQVSIVPEPSAIALGVLALIYFLLFFRRHHWVA